MINEKNFRLTNLILLIACLVMFSGCVGLNSSGGSYTDSTDTNSAETIVEAEPYYPTDHRDILIPAELAWHRDQSVSITTASFSGGILNYSGRVEVNSLTDFFINSMKKDQWQLTGSVKSKDVFLAFVKPNATCMIRISEGGMTTRTNVFIYVTKDLQ